MSAPPRSASAFLLLPYLPLSFAYLAALRAGWLKPSFLPPLLAAVLPLASAVLSALSLARGSEKRRDAFLLLVAILELAWGVAVLAIVGFAIAAQSG